MLRVQRTNNNNMTEQYSEGDIVKDDNEIQSEEVVSPGRLVVVRFLEDNADDVVVDWESDMTPITVADLNPDYESDADVVEAVYIESLDKRLPDWTPEDGVEEIVSLIDRQKLKSYSFPKSRLVPE